jgi:hypothetical protein
MFFKPILFFKLNFTTTNLILVICSINNNKLRFQVLIKQSRLKVYTIQMQHNSFCPNYIIIIEIDE